MSLINMNLCALLIVSCENLECNRNSKEVQHLNADERRMRRSRAVVPL